MTCTQCNSNEVTKPNITGELCTKCYFGNRRNKLESSPVVVPTEQPTEESESKVEIVEFKQTRSKSKEIPNDGNKYCQSCLERGSGPVLATREWTKDYFICDDCLEPLINQMIEYDATREQVESAKSKLVVNSPVLEQFYQILNVPENLRLKNSDQVISNRNEIFNYSAIAIANLSLEAIQEKNEIMRIMFRFIKYSMDPLTQEVDRIKYEERQKKNLDRIEKSRKDVGKGPSKVKMSKLEKEAKVMFPHIADPEERLKTYQKLIGDARKDEFDKIVGE